MGLQYGEVPQFIDINQVDDHIHSKGLKALPKNLSCFNPIYMGKRIFFPLCRPETLPTLNTKASSLTKVKKRNQIVRPFWLTEQVLQPVLPNAKVTGPIKASQPIKAYEQCQLESSLIGFIEFTQNSLTREDLQRISDVIDLIMSLKDDGKAELDQLRVVEEQMAKEYCQIDNSVLLLMKRNKKRQAFRRRDIDFEVPSSYVLIEGKEPFEIYTMALSHHYHQKSYAFLFYSDLDTQSRVNIKSLQSLGNISVYIPDITTLSQVEAEALLNLLKASERVPTLIGGKPRNSQSMTLTQSELKQQLGTGTLHKVSL